MKNLHSERENLLNRKLIEQIRASEEAAFLEFFQEHPEVRDCESNKKFLKEFHRGEPITVQSLSESAGYLGDLLARRGPNEVEEVHAERSEQKREAIKAENARLKALSPAELRQMVKDSKPGVSRELPAEFTAKVLRVMPRTD